MDAAGAASCSPASLNKLQATGATLGAVGDGASMRRGTARPNVGLAIDAETNASTTRHVVATKSGPPILSWQAERGGASRW